MEKPEFNEFSGDGFEQFPVPEKLYSGQIIM